LLLFQNESTDRGFQGIQGGFNDCRGQFEQERLKPSGTFSRFDTNRLGPPAYDPFSRSENQGGFGGVREEIQVVRSEFGQRRNFDSDAFAMNERRTSQYDFTADRGDFERRSSTAFFSEERGGSGVFNRDFGSRLFESIIRR
jgi:hypothetical protein